MDLFMMIMDFSEFINLWILIKTRITFDFICETLFSIFLRASRGFLVYVSLRSEDDF